MRGALLFSMFLVFHPNAFAVGGGIPVGENEAVRKSVVNIMLKRGICSGFVVGEDVVAAAAHCRDLFGEPRLVAFIGKGQTKPCDIANVIDHAYVPNSKPELFMGVHAPDLILFKLDKPLCSAEKIEISDRELKPKDRVWSTGQGAGNTNYGEIDKFEVEILENTDEELMKHPDPLDEDALEVLSQKEFFVFALPVKEDSALCVGDSGGPLYEEIGEKPVVVGINSLNIINEKLGRSRCDYSYLQAFAPIQPYREWILSKVADWGPTPNNQTAGR